jgi:hypothetical protein
MSRQSWQSIGEAGFARSERVSSELLALTCVHPFSAPPAACRFGTLALSQELDRNLMTSRLRVFADSIDML